MCLFIGASFGNATVYNGTYGKVNWAFDTATGLLSITGNGEMGSDGREGVRKVPWHSLDSLITRVEIADGVTTIDCNAFKDCFRLTDITIPKSVCYVGDNAFEGTAWWNQQTDSLIYLNNWLLGYKGYKPCGGIIIKDGTVGVADYAFDGCESITDVEIPNSVVFICDYAFSGLGLSVINIPNSVESIGFGAFRDCI